MKRMRYDDEAALGPDGKRLHTDASAAIPGSETVYRLLVPAKKVRTVHPYRHLITLSGKGRIFSNADADGNPSPKELRSK